MGKFEDLVQAARDGDETALDALESEFSGSSLRERAEAADSYKENYEKALPLVRKARLDDLLGQLDDELKGSDLSVADFGEFDPDTLTLDTVKERAKSRIDTAQESKLAIAKDSGFDTVEEFETAVQAAKQQKDQQKRDMEDIAGGAASSGGLPSGSEEGSLFDKAKKAHEEAKKLGQDDGKALGASIGALIEAQEGTAE